MILDRAPALRSARLDVAEARAQRRSASTWSNPVLEAEMNTLNPSNGRFFDLSSTSQQTISLQTPIDFASKRTARVELADARIRELEFELRRRERMVLAEAHEHITTIATEELRLRTLQRFADLVRPLISRFDSLAQLDVVPRVTAFRLRSLLATAESARWQAATTLLHARHSLALLASDTGAMSWSVHVPTRSAILATPFSRSLSVSLQQRSDILAAQERLSQSDADIQLQRRSAIPDISAGLLFDKRGSAWDNYTAVTVSVPLPLFDRNQGAIESAIVRRDAALLEIASRINAATMDSVVAYQQFMLATERLQALTGTGPDDGEQILSLITPAFSAGSVTLVEFVDIFSATMDATFNYIDAVAAWLNAANRLNTALDAEVIPLE
jgi:cobalt-zinc-cadmium efflux system outer membrane protein